MSINISNGNYFSLFRRNFQSIKPFNTYNFRKIGYKLTNEQANKRIIKGQLFENEWIMERERMYKPEMVEIREDFNSYTLYICKCLMLSIHCILCAYFILPTFGEPIIQ